MNKKLLIATLAATAIAAAGLSACEHEHTFSGDWTSDATNHWHEATCEHTDEVSGKAEHTLEDGKCTVCGYVVETEHEHTFSVDWTSDATNHWHGATCEHADEVSGKAEHTIEDGKCTVCGYTAQAYKAVTEEEFNEAVGIFVLDTEDYFEKYGDKLNFTVRLDFKVDYGNKVEEMGAIAKLDCPNKKMYVYDNSISDKVESAYSWQSGDGFITCRVENGEEIKEEGYGTWESYIISAIEETTFMFFVGTGENPYNYLSEMGLTYDGQTGLYSVRREIQGTTVDVQMGFSDGKLVYLNGTDAQGRGQQTFYYSDYGTTQFTIPENILDMPLTQI